MEGNNINDIFWKIKLRSLKPCYRTLREIYTSTVSLVSEPETDYEKLEELAQKAEACVIHAALVCSKGYENLRHIMESYMNESEGRERYRNMMMKMSLKGVIPTRYAHMLAELRGGRSLIEEGDDQQKMLGAYHIKQAIYDAMLTLSEESE